MVAVVGATVVSALPFLRHAENPYSSLQFLPLSTLLSQCSLRRKGRGGEKGKGKGRGKEKEKKKKQKQKQQRKHQH